MTGDKCVAVAGCCDLRYVVRDEEPLPVGGPAWPCYRQPDGETEDRVPYEHVRAEGEQTDEAQNFCQHGLQHVIREALWSLLRGAHCSWAGPRHFQALHLQHDLIGCITEPVDFVAGGTCEEQLMGMCETL